MAINITKRTVNVIQLLVKSAFNTNATFDRIKTYLNAQKAFPITSKYVHILAHKYALTIADSIGDIIENKNELVNYGGIPIHEENYESVKSALDKILELVIDYQNELNKASKIAFDNMDVHVFKSLLDSIGEVDKYVEQAILWVDIAERYGDSPSLDVHMEHYNILGE